MVSTIISAAHAGQLAVPCTAHGQLPMAQAPLTEELFAMHRHPCRPPSRCRLFRPLSGSVMASLVVKLKTRGRLLSVEGNSTRPSQFAMVEVLQVVEIVANGLGVEEELWPPSLGYADGTDRCRCGWRGFEPPLISIANSSATATRTGGHLCCSRPSRTISAMRGGHGGRGLQRRAVELAVGGHSRAAATPAKRKRHVAGCCISPHLALQFVRTRDGEPQHAPLACIILGFTS
jgi:hypothetical protein